MKYRKLDSNGDYTFGSGNDFYADSPETVAQAVQTRLLLYQGDWFLDPSAGVPWRQSILGEHPEADYNTILQDEILNTQGVKELVSYSSDLTNRYLSIQATILTDYGQATVYL